jgi:hypothetical protein
VEVYVNIINGALNVKGVGEEAYVNIVDIV